MSEQDRLVEVEKQIAMQAMLMSKFDTALDKISEVSLNVSKLLAVHEQRLETQEEVSKEFPLVLENRRQEFSQHISELHGRITSSDQELRKEMTNGQKEILNEIKSLRHDLTEQSEVLKTELQSDFTNKIDAVSGRVSKLEKLAYLVIGGALVVGFFLSQAVSWLGVFHK